MQISLDIHNLYKASSDELPFSQVGIEEDIFPFRFAFSYELDLKATPHLFIANANFIYSKTYFYMLWTVIGDIILKIITFF